jgi:hypothetical protein
MLAQLMPKETAVAVIKSSEGKITDIVKNKSEDTKEKRKPTNEKS